MLDPCNYVGAFWNGPAYLEGMKHAPLLLKLSPAIAALVIVAVLALGAKFANKKQSE